jgi:hypothetical protein
MSAITRNQNSSRLAIERRIAAGADGAAGPGTIRSPDGWDARGALRSTGEEDCMAASARGWRKEAARKRLEESDG